MNLLKLIKAALFSMIGGFLYILVELLYRGYSHWTMFFLGGLMFFAVGRINEVLSWDTPLCLQALIGGTMILIVEFVAGMILNIWLGWGIWDYSNLPFNILGQICLPFWAAWIALSVPIILLDDFLCWKMFGGKKPHYTLF